MSSFKHLGFEAGSEVFGKCVGLCLCCPLHRQLSVFCYQSGHTGRDKNTCCYCEPNPKRVMLRQYASVLETGTCHGQPNFCS